MRNLIYSGMFFMVLFECWQYVAPDYLPVAYEGLPTPPTHRDAVINAYVYVHQTLHQANTRVAKRGGRTMAITPRHYLDFINHYVSSISPFAGTTQFCALQTFIASFMSDVK